MFLGFIAIGFHYMPTKRQQTN